MYTVEMLPAAQGDCLWVEYGPDGKIPARILIDGGTGSILSIYAEGGSNASICPWAASSSRKSLNRVPAQTLTTNSVGS